MKIGDFAMYVPNAALSTLLKVFKFNIDEIGKDEILKNGLYHITSSEEVVDKIIESQYLRPSTGITKNISAYGRASVFLFNGTPSVENFMKNLTNSNLNLNVYLNPTMVVNALKIQPTERKELANYKARGLVDDVIVYEGYCVLPKEKTQKVKLVPDLIRDEEGNPIVNEQTGKYDIKFREVLPEELNVDGQSYIAKEDYLKFVEEQRKEFGYLDGNSKLNNVSNTVNNIVHLGTIENNMFRNRIKKIPELIKQTFKRWTTPKLDMPIDERISKQLEESNHSKKNPYRDEKFGKAVANFQAQGLEQLDLKHELEEITTSDIGKYFRRKYEQIDKDVIIANGIHGINHNNRVAIHSMIIAKNEGLLNNDIDSKTLDLLISAAYYHDIGRKKGPITDNYGPHAKNSSRKIKKINLTYLNGQSYSEEDRKILQAIVEAHEAKDKKMDKICKKYKIEPQKIEYTKQLMNILKDADALDRVRLDTNIRDSYGYKFRS